MLANIFFLPLDIPDFLYHQSTTAIKVKLYVYINFLKPWTIKCPVIFRLILSVLTNIHVKKIARLQQAAIAINLIHAIHFNTCIAFLALHVLSITFYALHPKHYVLCIEFFALDACMLHVLVNPHCSMLSLAMLFNCHSRHWLKASLYYISMHMFLYILIYWFYSLHIDLCISCNYPFVSTIHLIICIIVYA